MSATPANTLVVPVYRNADTVVALVEAVQQISDEVPGDLEAIFVVDGCSDGSGELLTTTLAGSDVNARIVEHSRNFGSFAAIRTGMAMARGSRIAVMAADLQEPPSLVVQFFCRLASGDVDVLAGERASRGDDNLASKLYWRLYRRFVMDEMPRDGVDVFACTDAVRDVICSMEARHTSLVAQLFWVGFRRELIPYHRRPRAAASGWTLQGKVRYLSDSVFAFTDLPVRILWVVGVVGLCLGVLLGLLVLIARIAGVITVPGYAATMLVIVFFASLNLLGLGIIGSYVWRAYDTAKQRPGAVVRNVTEIPEQSPYA
jgi:glycosyltransferase involved in cell wall biosynthesis